MCFVIKNIIVPILVAVITFVLSYFVYFGPQINLLKSDIAWQNLEMLSRDIETKWLYSQDNPVFDEVESLGERARDAITDGQFDTANKLIQEARDLLRTLPGPPVMYYPWSEEWWQRPF